MKTRHIVYFDDAQTMSRVADNSVDLMVTSPPYPMIEMWDESFFFLNPAIRDSMNAGLPAQAFEWMHRELDPVWEEVFRVLKPGGIACVNIGDATRTVNGDFALYTNHARIATFMQKLGFVSLPAVIWRKQTNAPNKFMGSGMLPPGAYVTLEHEYILIFRKGGKMAFPGEDAQRNRRESAFFWEERNLWFSDVWMDLKGTGQTLTNGRTRDRSAAFPFELAYRLIAMFSVKGAMVLDPFMGTGTTLTAAIAAGRNSVGYEVDTSLKETIAASASAALPLARNRITARLKNHAEFVKNRLESGQSFKHANEIYGFPVMTRQETELFLNRPLSFRIEGDAFESTHTTEPTDEDRIPAESPQPAETTKPAPPKPVRTGPPEPTQINLFDDLE